jgi:hypothetical protein
VVDTDGRVLAAAGIYQFTVSQQRDLGGRAPAVDRDPPRSVHRGQVAGRDGSTGWKSDCNWLDILVGLGGHWSRSARDTTPPPQS